MTNGVPPRESACPKELRELFASARHDDPDPSQVDELWRSLEPVVGGPDGTGGAPTPTAVRETETASWGSLASYGFGGASVAALILAASTWQGWPHPATRSPTQPVVEAEAVPVSSSPESLSMVIEQPHSGHVVSPTRAPQAPSTGDAQAAPTETEAHFLKRAHGHLRQGDPSFALTMAEQHQQLYPQGILSQERELIRIEALTMMGQRDAAMRVGAEFLRQYPRSAHARRVLSILHIEPNDGEEKKDVTDTIISDASVHSPVEDSFAGDAGR